MFVKAAPLTSDELTTDQLQQETDYLKHNEEDDLILYVNDHPEKVIRKKEKDIILKHLLTDKRDDELPFFEGAVFSLRSLSVSYRNRVYDIRAKITEHLPTHPYASTLSGSLSAEKDDEFNVSQGSKKEKFKNQIQKLLMRKEGAPLNDYDTCIGST